MVRGELREKERARLRELGIGEKVLAECAALEFEPGEFVCRQGIILEHLMLVESGKAKVCNTAENGRDVISSYYLSDGLVGDVELMLGSYEADCSVAAITELRCIALPYRTCAGPLRQNVDFLNYIGRELARKLARRPWDYFNNAALYSGEERLCAYIRETSYRGFFRELLTDTASSIGVSYRHLHRMLAALCGAGVLEKTPQGYWIADQRRLEERAAR